ncbi:hypothetical protein PGT21_020258 [Puccinia graminis f. sp. tritici]|uniref:Uncharacterized protein n=1 Tax=Puccinia graminis f. sp. tritici TaxID=56615 RepID=A0A5B0P9U1_PUCGR|nr:hypothetical protein PGT21_020258 [Puccinia graminis f. sp. tritici]KAA1125972.1 hypothetical protein PGTUg99_000979 [Puccinia graminis f. sp. tritici]
MQRGHHLRPSYQTSDRYEARIRHLEDVVCLLLARKDPHQLPFISTAPLNNSFRYCKQKGLVPLLSKAATESLSTDLQSIKQEGTIPLIKPGYYAFSYRSLFNCSPPVTQPPPPQPPAETTSRERQFKTTKGHEIMSAGFRRPLTISQVYQGRANSEITDEQCPPVPALDRASSDQTQEPRPFSSPAVPHCLPQSEVVKDSAPSPLILLKTPPLRSGSLNCFLSSDCPMSDDINRGLTKLEIQPSTGDPQSSCSTMTSSPPSENLDLKADDGLALFLSKDNLTSATNHQTDTPAHSPVNPIIIVADDSLPTSFLANPAATSATDNTSNLTPPLVSTSPPDPTATTPLLTTIPASTLQPEPAMPNCSSDSFDIAAIGSITVMEDSTAFKDPQLWAPSLSQAALENYKDIDDYLKTLEVDETEMKKKKKKKKKKKTPDPTSIPDNPVLFYAPFHPSLPYF